MSAPENPLGASGAGEVPDWLLGRWRFLRADASLDFAPSVRMDFRDGGHLDYTVEVEGHTQTFPLVYRVDGDVLLTDNPAAPHATATRFQQGEGDVLVFDFAGALALFVRESRL